MAGRGSCGCWGHRGHPLYGNPPPTQELNKLGSETVEPELKGSLSLLLLMRLVEGRGAGGKRPVGFLVLHPRARHTHSPCPSSAPGRGESGGRAKHVQFIVPKYTKLIIGNSPTSPGQREEGAEGGRNRTHHTLSLRKETVGEGKDLSPQW